MVKNIYSTAPILIFYGNKKYYKENIATGLFLIYVGFMQLFEYLIWIDIDNKKSYNKIGTIFGSIFNFSQPTALFVFNTIISNKHNLLLLILNRPLKSQKSQMQ